MKNTILIAAALCCFLAGCRTAGTTQPPAPGYATAAEQSVGETIAGANAVVLKYEADVKAGTYVPTAAMTAAVSAIQKALVIADPLALAWHNALASNPAAAEPAGLSSAVSTINTNIGTLPKVAQ
jgi:hypothetical protein